MRHMHNIKEHRNISSTEMIVDWFHLSLRRALALHGSMGCGSSGYSDREMITLCVHSANPSVSLFSRKVT
jgi:hypothetical protein